MWKRLNAKSIMKLAMNVQTIMSDLLSYPRAYRILFCRDSGLVYGTDGSIFCFPDVARRISLFCVVELLT